MKKMMAVSSRAYGEGKPIDIEPGFGDSKIITFVTEIITLPGPTRNGILYPLEDFKKAVADERVQDMLKRGSFYGEPDHPVKPEDLNRWVRPEMEHVTHKWNKLWFEGNKLMGECQTFTGNGNLLYHAIANGELPAFSIRVVGNPHPKGEFTELSDIVLIAIDWVRYPGNPTSYVSSSDVFNVKELPAYKGFDYNSRVVTKAESANILNIKEEEDVISLGEGCYVVVDKLNKNERKEIRDIRSNCFI